MRRVQLGAATGLQCATGSALVVLVAVLRELRVVLGRQCGWVPAVVLVYVTHGVGGIYAKIGARQAMWNWDCVGFCKRVLPLCRGCMLLLLRLVHAMRRSALLATRCVLSVWRLRALHLGVLGLWHRVAMVRLVWPAGSGGSSSWQQQGLVLRELLSSCAGSVSCRRSLA